MKHGHILAYYSHLSITLRFSIQKFLGVFNPKALLDKFEEKNQNDKSNGTFWTINMIQLLDFQNKPCLLSNSLGSKVFLN
uniref:Uncharacterized protein n=1 Tax=Arundo donax TaxID=35708 RepID=A0A0A9DLL0_ARUDO